MPQTPAHMRKVTQCELTKPLLISGTFPKKHSVLTCMPTRRAPYACHVHTHTCFLVRRTCTYTLTFTRKFSNSDILAAKLSWGLSGIINCKLWKPVLPFSGSSFSLSVPQCETQWDVNTLPGEGVQFAIGDAKNVFTQCFLGGKQLFLAIIWI